MVRCRCPPSGSLREHLNTVGGKSVRQTGCQGRCGVRARQAREHICDGINDDLSGEMPPTTHRVPKPLYTK